MKHSGAFMKTKILRLAADNKNKHSACCIQKKNGKEKTQLKIFKIIFADLITN
jgi:hypothetical protein